MVNYKQLGTTGLDRHGGSVYEEFIPGLRWPWAAKVYKEMADNDPVIGAILYLAEMLIRKTCWTVKAAGESAADKEAADFLKSCMDDMDIAWADTITEILSMLTYGFSFHETLYKIRRGPRETNPKYKSKYSDGKVGWRGFPVRSQSSLLEWKFNDYGDVEAFVQQAPPNYKSVEIPMSKGLLFRTRVSRDNPEGKSLLRNAYRPWFFKKRIEEIEGIGIERDLAGLPVLQAPEGLDLWDEADTRMAGLRANAENLVASIRRDSEEGILLPPGWVLTLLSTGSSRQFDTNAIINRYDYRIATTLLSDIVLIGSDASGSFALADTKKALLSSALEAQVKNIATTFNSFAVPKLFEYNNFDLEKLPEIVPGEIEVPNLKELALILRSMNIDITKDMELMNFIRKVSSMPTLDEDGYNKIYANMTEESEKKPVVNDGASDIINNVMEQSDMAYT
jgi:hypothetical protein